MSKKDFQDIPRKSSAETLRLLSDAHESLQEQSSSQGVLSDSSPKIAQVVEQPPSQTQQLENGMFSAKRPTTIQMKVLQVENIVPACDTDITERIVHTLEVNRGPQQQYDHLQSVDQDRCEEVMGLDDALLKITTLSQQGNSSLLESILSQHRTTSVNGGEESNLSHYEQQQQSNGSRRTPSIRDGKDLLAYAYGMASEPPSNQLLNTLEPSSLLAPIVRHSYNSQKSINEESEYDSKDSSVCLDEQQFDKFVKQGAPSSLKRDDSFIYSKTYLGMQVIEEDVDLSSEQSSKQLQVDVSIEASAFRKAQNKSKQRLTVSSQSQAFNAPNHHQLSSSSVLGRKQSSHSNRSYARTSKSQNSSKHQKSINPPTQTSRSSSSESASQQQKLNELQIQEQRNQKRLSRRLTINAFNKTNSHLIIGNIQKILSLPKKERNKKQLATLIQYFQTVKVFKDMLIRNEKDKDTAESSLYQEEVKASFEHLASSVHVKNFQSGTILMEEGQDGDLFYIILQGECQVIKSASLTIHNNNTLVSKTKSDSMEQMKLYFDAFVENYDEIFWSGMDISRSEVDEMLGVEIDLRVAKDDESQNLEEVRTRVIQPSWPLHQNKQQLLKSYIKRHEKNVEYYDMYGNPAILVNKHLVNLQAGAGFGELALMSDKKRMATVKTNTQCILATLTRKDFMNVMSRAQKRKMESQVGFLKSFALFKGLSSMKLQKLFYLLKEVNKPKGSTLYRQGDEPITGVYLIKEGEIAYEIKHEMTKHDYSNTSWLNPSLLKNNMDKQTLSREIALFTRGRVIGYEEILRKRLLYILKKEFIASLATDLGKKDVIDKQFSDETLQCRNFTAIVKSSGAKLYFLATEDLQKFLRYLPKDQVQNNIEKRMTFLFKQVQTLEKVSKAKYKERQHEIMVSKLMTTTKSQAQKQEQVSINSKEVGTNSLSKSSSMTEVAKSRKMLFKNLMGQSQHQQQPPSLLENSYESSLMSVNNKFQSPNRRSIEESKLSQNLMIAVQQQSKDDHDDDKEKMSYDGEQFKTPKTANFGNTRFRNSLYSKTVTNGLNKQQQVPLYLQNRLGSSRGTDQYQPQESIESQERLSSQQSFSKRFSLDVKSTEPKKNSIIASASIDHIIDKPRHSLIKVRDKNNCGFNNYNNLTYLPFLSTTNKKTPATSNSQEQFEDPYSSTGNIMNKTNWPTKTRRGMKFVPKQHFLSQNNISLKSCSSSKNSPSQQRLKLLSMQQQSSKEYVLKSHKSSTDTIGQMSLGSIKYKQPSTIGSRQNLARKDVEKASIKISEQDRNKNNMRDEDLVQKNFIKYTHRQKSEEQAHGLSGFMKQPFNEQKRISLMRQAEQNSIERKQTSFRTKLESSMSSMLQSPLTQTQQDLSPLRESPPRNNILQAKANRRQANLLLQPQQSAQVVGERQIEQAIEDSDKHFSNRMLKVLDGILAPVFDPQQNKKEIDSLQQKIEQAQDDYDNKSKAPRRSDLKIMDKGQLGPVYCKIMAERRRKQNKRISGLSVGDKAANQQPQGLAKYYSNKNSPHRMQDSSSKKQLERHESMRSIKEKILTLTSFGDHSIKIKSMNSKIKSTSSSRFSSRRDKKVSIQVSRDNSFDASFLQPMLHKQQSIEQQKKQESEAPPTQLMMNSSEQVRKRFHGGVASGGIGGAQKNKKTNQMKIFRQTLLKKSLSKDRGEDKQTNNIKEVGNISSQKLLTSSPITTKLNNRTKQQNNTNDYQLSYQSMLLASQVQLKVVVKPKEFIKTISSAGAILPVTTTQMSHESLETQALNNLQGDSLLNLDLL